MQISNPIFFFVLWGWFCLLAAGLAYLTGRNRKLQTSGEFYPGIEGLRGILALNVFFHHAVVTYFFLRTGNWDLPGSNFYAQLGPLSVSMFFFITGFLFWSKRIASPSMPAWPFLKKRWRRLMPAYLGSLALILAITAYQTHFKLQVPLHSLVLQIGAWAVSGLFGYPHINGFASAQINASVFWTLRLEWEFYLLLPLLGWFARRKSALEILLVSLVLSIALGSFPDDGSKESLLARAQLFAFSMAGCFSVGILTAHLKAERKQWPLLKHPLCTPVAILLLLGVLLYMPPIESFAESLLLAPVFLMVVYGNDFHGLLTSRPMMYLGKISYSVYLLHGIVLYVLVQGVAVRFHLVSFHPIVYWSLMAVVGGVVIVTASVSYRFLELPFLGKSARKQVAAPVMVLAGVASETVE